jgi:hypothetical protein
MQAITGNSRGIAEAVSPAAITAAWESGKLVVLGTKEPKSDHITPSHAYPVVAYDASSGAPFEIFNPWGTSSASAAPGNPAPARWSSEY